ncbi:hypothetical protein [Corynebacterium freiburgense]|uniref:hypothetical protein n=1 Tax=Corynebacterium freiburgense TaxID=556548 RepID=UPI00047A94C2|nr:hypothetical protein [Corynebacterium freiburgense]WJZ02153.1 hypothetical protein CFREI_04275 [Corynebacterium freiburgense]
MPSLRKEDLRTNNGKPLFPEHQFHTVTYSLSPRHQRLCQQIRNVTSSPNTIQAKLENAVTFISPDFYDYDKPDRDPELPHNAEDHKWQSLQLILDDYMKTQKPENEPTKIIIYTNFHSTGDYLKQKLCAYFGNNESVEKVETSEIRNETVGFAASHSSANAISGTL